MQKRVLTSYKKLPKKVKDALKTEYPMGFDDVLSTIKFSTNGETFSALLYNYNETTYLIKYTRKKIKDVRQDDAENDNVGEYDDELDSKESDGWNED